MFHNYPKQRPVLPPEYERVHTKQYKENRQGSTTASQMSQRMESWMHRRVAEDVTRSRSSAATLEIGAGTLNHLQYEPLSKPYDIVEPFKFLFDASPELERVRNTYSDLSEVPAAARYDRIISVASLEHICNLPEVIARCGLLLNEGGQLRAGIPSEGTIMWYLGWRFTTGLEFKIKYNLDYGVVMKHEHVNTAKEIEQVLRYFFAGVQCSVFGLGRWLSLYQFYACSKPEIDKCRDYLKALA